MVKETDIIQFLCSDQRNPLIDVRSPKEYSYAHIPGAINVPLFTDEERAMVGIAYKRQGREAAILKGLELTGPKMKEFVSSMQTLLKNTEGAGGIYLHCWRGGMRSKSMATLFDFSGIRSTVIKGGYKSYRRTARSAFENRYPFIILGGRTGSAKTKILEALSRNGEQVIDLEKMAHHKGSAFGDLGETEQPSTEMFENELFETLRRLDPQKRIWLEDESNLIGKVFIPDAIWQQMRIAPVVYCHFPKSERIRFLVEQYGRYDPEGIIRSVQKITKKLGPQHAKASLEHFAAGNLEEATGIVLVYYDKYYDQGLCKRDAEKIITVNMEKIDPDKNARFILETISSPENNAIQFLMNQPVLNK